MATHAYELWQVGSDWTWRYAVGDDVLCEGRHYPTFEECLKAATMVRDCAHRGVFTRLRGDGTSEPL